MVMGLGCVVLLGIIYRLSEWISVTMLAAALDIYMYILNSWIAERS